MTKRELKKQLRDRQKELKLSFRDLQARTGLGYNTVRRVFDNPFQCRFQSVLIVCETMGCSVAFAVENNIADDVESGTQPPPEQVIKELKGEDR